MMPVGSTAAHEGFADASPEPGATVDGVLDTVEIDFGPPVVDPRIVLLDPDDRPVTAALELVGDWGARITFESIERVGVYTVRFIASGIDGHLISGSYSFGYRTAAPGADSEGGSLGTWMIVTWTALAVVAVGSWLAIRRARTRARTASA